MNSSLPNERKLSADNRSMPPNWQFTEDTTPQEYYENWRFTVDNGQSPLRIDKYLMVRIENASRNKIQRAADYDCIKVNGKPVKPSYKVKAGDLVQVFIDKQPREIQIIPQEIPLNIVYEDDYLIIVNKPANMVVHPAYGNYEKTMLNALYYYFLHSKNNKPDTKPLLVHRIDKDTTGLLVVTKTEEAQTLLAEQFYYHTIERTYTALVWGDLQEDNGVIDKNLARDPNNRKIITTVEPPQGKHAVTHWHVLKRFGYTTLIQCNLETGRTHQIRVHMKSIGHPLFGDKTYGGDQILKGNTSTKYKAFVENCFELLPRQALHATTLGFIHPITKEKLSFTSPLADDFQQVLNKWENYITDKNV